MILIIQLHPYINIRPGEMKNGSVQDCLQALPFSIFDEQYPRSFQFIRNVRFTRPRYYLDLAVKP